jgi:hypothetical protein
MSTAEKLDYFLQNFFKWKESRKNAGYAVSYLALARKFRVPKKLLEEIRNRDNDMWIGLAILLATLAGAVFIHTNVKGPKHKPIKPKIIAVALYARRAKDKTA